MEDNKKYSAKKVLEITARVKESAERQDISKEMLKIENGVEPFQQVLAGARIPIPLRKGIQEALSFSLSAAAATIGPITPIVSVGLIVASVGMFFSSGDVSSSNMKLVRRFGDWKRFIKEE